MPLKINGRSIIVFPMYIELIIITVIGLYIVGYMSMQKSIPDGKMFIHKNLERAVLEPTIEK